jgi:hypothetical protein
MSGSGSWKNLLPDGISHRLYVEIYPLGAPLPTLSAHIREFLPAWEQAGIVRLEDQKIIPLGPIMTNADLFILNSWFKDIANFMSQVVMEGLDDYRMLASNLAKGHSSRKKDMDNLLTILICALTLDSWVFSRFRREVIGTYPPRGVAGDFFFWGYAFATGPQRIFGFTTYNGLDGKQLHIIRSHGLDRRSLKAVLNRRDTWNCLNRFFEGWDQDHGTSLFDRHQSLPWKTVEDSLQKVGLLTLDNPPQLAIPIFDDSDREAVSELCLQTSQKIMDHFLLKMEGLQYLANQCSFARCSWPDVLCMLFHLAYSYAADRLVEKGVISDFPQRAGGEWGVWIS